MKTKYYAGMTTLFVVVIMGFVACPSNSVADKAAVSAALNTEKAKYQTGINLSGLSDGTDVSNKVVELVAGNKANATITRVVSDTSRGWLDLTEKGSLVFYDRSSKEEEEEELTDEEKAEIAEKAADPEQIRAKAETPWREAMKDIQVVTVQFEKGGVTSNLDVLCAFNASPSDIGDTWLVYGYDEDSGKPKTKPVLDRAKLNAASWIVTDGGKDSFKYADTEVLAMFAAQGFIDDVLSKTTGQIQAVYGTHLIVRAPKGGTKSGSLGPVADGDRIPLWELEEAVKEMHVWTEQNVSNRQAAERPAAPRWVKSIEIVLSDKAKKDLTIRDGWYSVIDCYTRDQWQNGVGTAPTDFNSYATGPHIYGIFQGTDDVKEAIADIVIRIGKDEPAPPGYTKINVDLNKGADGSYLYLCYRRVNKDDGDAVAWIGGVIRKHAINEAYPADALKGFNWTVPERDFLYWVTITRLPGQVVIDNMLGRVLHRHPVDLNNLVMFADYVYLTQHKRPTNLYGDFYPSEIKK